MKSSSISSLKIAIVLFYFLKSQNVKMEKIIMASSANFHYEKVAKKASDKSGLRIILTLIVMWLIVPTHFFKEKGVFIRFHYEPSSNILNTLTIRLSLYPNIVDVIYAYFVAW